MRAVDHLGISQLAVPAGLHPYKSKLDLWCEIMGLVPKFEGNEFTKWGDRLEPAILAEYSECMSVSVRRSTREDPIRALIPDHPWLRGRIDALTIGDRRCPGCGLVGEAIVDAKNVGDRSEHRYGIDCTDQIPDEYLAQALGYCGALGIEQFDLAALIGGNRFRVFHVHADAATYQSLVAAAVAFWNDHVLANVRPELDAGEGCAEYLKRKHPRAKAEKMVRAPGEVVAMASALRTARAARMEAEKTEKAIVHQIKDAIGDGLGFVGDFGSLRWGNVAGGLAYKEAYADLAAQYAPLAQAATAGGAPMPTADEILQAHRNAPSRQFRPTFKGEEE